MKKRKLEVVLGSGNVYRDFERPHADILQLKALLAAGIIRALNEMALTVREAERLTKIAAADFSRIRSANLGRFTVDRLMTILDRLGRDVCVRVKIEERARQADTPRAAKVMKRARSRSVPRKGDALAAR